MLDDLSFTTGFETPEVYLGELRPRMRRSAEQLLAQGAARAEAAGIAVQTRLVEDVATRVWENVVHEAAAWKADLIVIGSHGRRGVWRLMLGSDAEQIVRHAAVPVLLVRAPDPERTAPA